MQAVPTQEQYALGIGWEGGGGSDLLGIITTTVEVKTSMTAESSSEIKGSYRKHVNRTAESPFRNVDVRFTGFRRESNESCALLGYYTASGGNFVPTFRDNLSVPSVPLSLEDGSDSFFRKVGKKWPLLFWVITRRMVEISYRRFGISDRSHLYPCPLKMGPIAFPEKSVRNYHYSLQNNTEGHSSQD